MPRRPEELVGRILANTYAVERLLGRGGMGAVFAARHVRTGGIFAVKVLTPEAAAEEEIYRRFQNEARIISALRHPNIVQVTDFDQDDDGTPFLVMELLLGEDLYQRLRRVERLPLSTTLDIVLQVGSALHAAHQAGVVHRDIKPQNVFLSQVRLTDHVVEVAKVVDFGVSKIRHAGSLATRTMGVFGTPYYMAPETTRQSREELDGRADQWALGVILYRCLTGKLPFDNPDPLAVLYQVVNEEPEPIARLCPELPPGVAQVVDRALAKDREQRFESMAEFVRALEGAAGVVTPLLPEVSGRSAASLPPPPKSSAEYASMEVTGAADVVSGASGRVSGARSHTIWILGFFALMLGSAGAAVWWHQSRAPLVVPSPVPPREAPTPPVQPTTEALPPPTPTPPPPTPPPQAVEPPPTGGTVEADGKAAARKARHEASRGAKPDLADEAAEEGPELRNENDNSAPKRFDNNF